MRRAVITEVFVTLIKYLCYALKYAMSTSRMLVF